MSRKSKTAIQKLKTFDPGQPSTDGSMLQIAMTNKTPVLFIIALFIIFVQPAETQQNNVPRIGYLTAKNTGRSA
jgi:hypothetical protein